MKEETAQELLKAAKKASGDGAGSITVLIEQLVQALGLKSDFIKAAREQHEARAKPARDYCLVNRNQLIAELEKVVPPKPEVAGEKKPDPWEPDAKAAPVDTTKKPEPDAKAAPVPAK